ncbi:sugar ABC transporter substrate-binding protein [Parasphingorhabdus pacifica]
MTITALGLLGAMTLTGCGSGSEVDANRVVYWDTSGSNESPVFAEIAEECGRAGGYEVEVERVTFDQALNNYKTAAQNGQGPDVLRADVGWVAQLANAGLIKDLSNMSLATDTSDYLDAPLKSTKHDGKTYAIPQVTDTLALFYNKRMLAEAGVNPPETWEELKRIAPRLGGENALFINNDAFYSLPFLYTYGGGLVDTEAETIELNSPESVRGLGIAKDLLEAGAARTALDPTNSYNNMKAAFNAGEVAMIIDGPWATPDFFASDTFADPADLGIAPIPSSPSPAGGHNYVVRQGTDADEASTKFVECMSSTENQAAISAKLGLLPTRESAYADPTVAEEPVVAAFKPLLEKTHPRAWIPEGNELMEPLEIAYADVLAGRDSTRAALDKAAKKYEDTILPDYTAG